MKELHLAPSRAALEILGILLKRKGSLIKTLDDSPEFEQLIETYADKYDASANRVKDRLLVYVLATLAQGKLFEHELDKHMTKGKLTI